MGHLLEAADAKRPLRDQQLLDLPDRLLDLVPAAVYVCDSDGIIVRYNRRAAELWGRFPEPGDPEERFCGSYRLYRLDGGPLPHDQCPMAAVLRTGVAVGDQEVVIERPDGSCIFAVASIEPIQDAAGAIVGAINCFRDITARKGGRTTPHAGRGSEPEAPAPANGEVASIVESADVAIVSHDLEGIIGSWNPAAGRLFGYSAAEAVGRPIAMLLPADREDEENALLERFQRGERVDQYETVRRRRDGSLIDVSLTVSPIRHGGEIVGASQIVRDNTERRRAQEQQTLLIREMHHRVRNLFALASSVVALSSRSARTASEMAMAVQGRLGALARAHALTMPNPALGEEMHDPVTTLHELGGEILSPYLDPAAAVDPPVVIGGPEIAIGGSAITSLALLLHEFATNAAKHGALSCPGGRVHVDWRLQDQDLVLSWREHGGPALDGPAEAEGFGSLLVRGTVQGQLGGRMSRDWGADGLTMTLTLPLARLAS